MPKYVGIDVHKQTCHATAMAENGKVLKQRNSQMNEKSSRGSSRALSIPPDLINVKNLILATSS